MRIRSLYTFCALMPIAGALAGCSASIVDEAGPGWSLMETPASFSLDQKGGAGASLTASGVPRVDSAIGSSRALDDKGGREPVTGKSAASITSGQETKPASRSPLVRTVKATVEPGKPPSFQTDAASGSAGTFAVVAKGDTLHGLSLKHKVSVKALMSANNLTSNKIFPGQKLAIPDASR